MLSRACLLCLAVVAGTFYLSVAAYPAAAAERLVIETRRIPLQAGNGENERAGKLIYRGGFALKSKSQWFGGFSSLHVSADGARFYALSDTGRWVSGWLHYDEDGNLAGVGGDRIGVLLTPAGKPVKNNEYDSEAMTLLSDGRIAVGFEGEPRIWIYPAAEIPFNWPPTARSIPDGLRFAAPNTGLEAMTQLPSGRLLLLHEDMRGPAPYTYAHHGWLETANGWADIAYDRVGLFRPVDMAVVPPGGNYAGDVLVLERAYYVVDFSTRVMRVPARQIQPGALLRPQAVATIMSPMTTENFEGIAVRRGARGELLVYIISDDNYMPSQRTLLMMFTLAE